MGCPHNHPIRAITRINIKALKINLQNFEKGEYPNSRMSANMWWVPFLEEVRRSECEGVGLIIDRPCGSHGEMFSVQFERCSLSQPQGCGLSHDTNDWKKIKKKRQALQGDPHVAYLRNIPLLKIFCTPKGDHSIKFINRIQADLTQV